MSQRVWIAQCLCPQRHGIVATAGEAEDEADANASVLEPLRQQVERMIASGEINPWCGLCRADTFRYEIGVTRWTTMEEAMPHLRANEVEQAITRALAGKY